MKRIAISNYTCPVISFCKINDIMLNTMKINKFMPPQVKSKKTFRLRTKVTKDNSSQLQMNG